MKSLIASILFAWIFSCQVFNANGKEIHLTSCSYADVQSAITSASSGDAIILPACSSPTWSSRLEITKANLSIIGQGTSNTTINGFGFLISFLSTGTRITGIHFNAGIDVPVIMVSSGDTYNGTPVTKWVIDDNKFTATGDGVISVYNGSTGLISNNSFHVANSDTTIYIFGRDDIDWANTSYFGEAGRYVFVEDNIFVSTSNSSNHVILSGWGGSYTFRCNRVTDSGGSNTYKDIVDVHGYGHGTNRRGGRSAEVYGNYFENRNYSSRTINLRAGSGRVFANRWLNANTYIGLTDYRLIDLGLAMAYPTVKGDCSSNSSSCASTAEATCCTAHEGYPCCDQIGMGQGQTSEPYYFWDNKSTTGVDIKITPPAGTAANFIKKNREFFIGSLPPGYSPYTYPHPARGLRPTGRCLSGVNSAADTDILFWSAASAPPPLILLDLLKGPEKKN